MSRYLVTHAPGCGCRETSSVLMDTPEQVMLYFWGIDVAEHVVYDYETPYRFFMGDIAMIQQIFQWFPAWLVRRHLPLMVPPGAPVCMIGDLACLRTSFFWYRHLATLPEVHV